MRPRSMPTQRGERRRSSSNTREYGSDEYWIERHARGGGSEDDTDEWLAGWPQLRALLIPVLPAGASVLDLGCGVSSLCFDLLRDHLNSSGRVCALDIAPGAIAKLGTEQQARMARGEVSAMRADLLCADATEPGAWLPLTAAFDAVVDKSTTDGLLCDTRRGAKRVRDIYAHVGKALRPEGVVIVASWRDPNDGFEWVADCVLGGLRSVEDWEAAEDTAAHWSVDVHSIELRDNDAAAPHIYVMQRRQRRLMRRQTATRAAARRHGVVEADVPVRHHLHPA